MKGNSLLEAISELSHEKGINQENIIEAIEDALVAAAYRKYKQYKNIDASFNPTSGEFELMRYRTVVEDIVDPNNEILLSDIRELDPQAECGDEVEYEIDSQEFTNVIAQSARQMIFQKVQEVEWDSIIENFSHKKGEIIHGRISRIEYGKTYLVINSTVEAVLDRKEQITFEKLVPGEHTRVLLLDIQNTLKGPQLIVSRSHPDFLIKLFAMEVPEVYDGIVEVIAAAREPGKRAKVSVRTNDPDVDPVGACVGMRGARIQTIITELCNERIDIIEWVENPYEYIANALAPAEVKKITIENIDGEEFVNAEVNEDQLSLAIGKQGQNVRLASQLTHYKINVYSTGSSLKMPSDHPIINNDN